MRRRSCVFMAALLCAGLVLGGCGGKKSAEKSVSAEKSGGAVSAGTVVAATAQTGGTVAETAASAVSTATAATVARTAETDRAEEKEESVSAGEAQSVGPGEAGRVTESADTQPKTQTPAPEQQTPAESGVAAVGEAEKPDAESSAQKITAESGEKTGAAQMADGVYVLTLNSTSGSAALSSGVLFVSGSPDYAATGSGLYDGSAQILQEGYYAFHCGSATIYQSSGGDGEPDTMSAAEFSQYLQGVEGSGLGLRITVQGGVVVCADITS